MTRFNPLLETSVDAFMDPQSRAKREARTERTRESGRSKHMKRTLFALLIVAAAGASAACSSGDTTTSAEPTSAAASAETQDAGFFGLVVPGSAVAQAANVPDSEASFDAAGMSFDEASEWMGVHLPTEGQVNGLAFCSAERLDGIGHSWYWAGAETEEGTPMVTVRVSDQDQPVIAFDYNPADVGGC